MLSQQRVYRTFGAFLRPVVRQRGLVIDGNGSNSSLGSTGEPWHDSAGSSRQLATPLPTLDFDEDDDDVDVDLDDDDDYEEEDDEDFFDDEDDEEYLDDEDDLEEIYPDDDDD